MVSCLDSVATGALNDDFGFCVSVPQIGDFPGPYSYEYEPQMHNF